MEVWQSLLSGEWLLKVRCDYSVYIINQFLPSQKKQNKTHKQKQKETPLKEKEQRSDYSARKRTMQNSSLENHEERNQAWSYLPSSVEIAITVIPIKCLKATTQSTQSISGGRKDSQIRLFDKGVKQSTEGTWKYFFKKYFFQNNILRLSFHCCDDKCKQE